MAGNKGRGRAAYTFNIEAVGFGRGEKLPDVVLKPPPLFPVSTLTARSQSVCSRASEKVKECIYVTTVMCPSIRR